MVSIVLSLFSMPALATDTSASAKSSSLYIQTTSIPDTAIQYAQNNVYRFMLSSVDEGLKTLKEIKSYFLGTPFALINYDSGVTLYYFPVIDKQSIVATLRVYEVNGEFYGIYSNVLVDELNSLTARVSAQKPAHLTVENSNLMLTLDGKTELLWERPPASNDEGIISESQSIQSSTTSADEELTTIDCFHQITYEQNMSSANIKSSIESTQSFPAYRYLPYFSNYITENQGSLPWCAAYVAAYIVRYRNSNTSTPTASTVMATMYPSETVSQRESHGLSDSKAVSYYNNCGFSASKVWSQISDSAVRTAIVNNKPIHLLCSNTSTYENHSMALVGYNDNTSILRIWNPWYTYGEDMDGGTKIYTAATGDSFEWIMTITVN